MSKTNEFKPFIEIP